MKILIILLLSTTGIEEIKFKTNGLNCSEMATAWREVNTTYYDMIEDNPKLQGNYTKEGKLMIGWIC
jgi:hypothetical protein|tara:strand:- start:227 stop:427 length:201 start_codon:yes stop_codon:yes gene_type:complete